MEALEQLREQRRLAGTRQLEKEQAELRMALNEMRRKAVKLEKSLLHSEGGNMLSRSAVKQAMAGEIADLELAFDASAAAHKEALAGCAAREPRPRAPPVRDTGETDARPSSEGVRISDLRPRASSGTSARRCTWRCGSRRTMRASVCS